MDADTFWKSSPRAVHLFIRYVRKTGGRLGMGRAMPGQRTGNRGGEKSKPKKVRLNYLPHP